MIRGITIIHINDMNTQRITISIPANIYALLTQRVASGNVSQYISETIHSRLIENKLTQKLKKDPVGEFLALRKYTTKTPAKKIIHAIHKGRQGRI